MSGKKKAAVTRIPPGDRRSAFDVSVFSQRVETLRREQGMSKTRFARFIGTSPNVIYWWERGRNSPSIYLIFQMARAFDVSADWILGLVDERKGLYE